MTTLKIKFILGQISQPRCLKRLEAIKNAGFEIAVYGFDNGLYNENIRNKDYKIHSIRIDGKGNKFVKSIKKICITHIFKDLEIPFSQTHCLKRDSKNF